jgi:hypothetical protein
MMRTICTALVCLLSSFVLAQDYRAEVFGGYSYLNADTNELTPRQSLNGWEGAITVNANKWVAIEGDVSGYYKTFTFITPLAPFKIDATDYGFLGGPRGSISGRLLFMLYLG